MPDDPNKFPDFRRKVGEWKDLTDRGTHSMIPCLMKYIRKGEGDHEPTPTDRLLGLEKVSIGWTRSGFAKDGDLSQYDDGPEDKTSCSFAVWITVNGDVQRLDFDIDFAGFGD